MEEVAGVVDVPSGYRFLPTDLELVRDYLCKKITNQKLPSDVPVVEYDIYSTEPWNLPVNNKIDTIRNNRSYYFVKLMNGIDHHTKRLVNPSCSSGGFWKRIAGGRSTRYIRDESYKPIGVRKSFEFHAYISPHSSNNNTTIISDDDDYDDEEDNKAENNYRTATTWKTSWIMDEYSINSQRTQSLVLCILRKKGGGGGGGEEEDDEVHLLSFIQQVQQQQENLHQLDHDLPHKELEILEAIKTIQEKITANQIQIWDDQYELRKLNESRIHYRRVKHRENVIARHKRFKEKWFKDTEGKITMADLDQLKKHQKEEIRREVAARKSEEATIRARSYYRVQQPSRFRKRNLKK